MKKMQSKNSHIVYSTGSGRVCPECGQPVDNCQCAATKPVHQGDGVVRIRREVKGRRGKSVTTISGIPFNEVDLKLLAAELKRKCGTGGSVKDGVIVIQGDQREVLQPLLKSKGFVVKQAGG